MEPKEKKFKWIWVGYAAVVLVFLAGGAWLVSLFLFSGDAKPQRQIQMVTLVKPPPPPPPPEKPPEPPPPEEQKLVEPEPEPEPADKPSDEPPPGEDLGVDAEGSGEGDGFGLVGKKGAASLIGGGGGGSLLRKYEWYTRILEEEIGKEVRRRLEGEGGLPDGKPKATIRIVLDPRGRIADFRIVGPSGDSRMDAALRQTLGAIQVSEPPPAGMPMTVNIAIKISSSSRG